MAVPLPRPPGPRWGTIGPKMTGSAVVGADPAVVSARRQLTPMAATGASEVT